MNKTTLTIIVIILIALGAYFLLKQPVSAPVNQPAATEINLEPAVGEPPAPAPTAPTADKLIIAYTDAGYAPTTLEIKLGETVTFKNQSNRPMWPASAVHPTHKVYPTTGGCLGSTFDACQGLAPGTDWSFKFDLAGTWKYHDHLAPTQTGTIIVK